MVTKEQVEEQLKRINFNYKSWGKREVYELPNILMEGEEIEECVNGYYEAGFALLVATKDRLLLVDKKPLNYLTVEDIRFDMISEFDYHHRLLGAQIRINAGYKTLLFTSWNQPRLRRLLHYVQTRMTQVKKDQSNHQTTQQKHLEEMNEQLRKYLIAAHKKQFIEDAEHISGEHIADTKNHDKEPPLILPAVMEAVAESMEPAPHAPTPHRLKSAKDFEQAAEEAFTGVQPDEPAKEQTGQTPFAQYLQNNIGQQATIQPDTSEDQNSVNPQQLVLGAARRVLPVIRAYTRLPLINQKRQDTGKHVGHTWRQKTAS